MKLVPLKRCYATAIAKEIIGYFHLHQISLEKFILSTSDGVSAMEGAKVVHVKLKEYCIH